MAMASSTVRISCSRGTCFSAFSWRRAPTKSRLMVVASSTRQLSLPGRRRRKKYVGVTHVFPGGHRVRREYTTLDRSRRRTASLGCAEMAQRTLELAGLALAILLLLRFTPPAMRAWRVYAGVRTRRLADAGP